jgi:hypothetical protein
MLGPGAVMNSSTFFWIVRETLIFAEPESGKNAALTVRAAFTCSRRHRIHEHLILPRD